MPKEISQEVKWVVIIAILYFTIPIWYPLILDIWHGLCGLLY